MDRELIEQLARFQHSQMVEFITAARAAGGIRQTRIYPQVAHDTWMLEFTFEDDETASWIVADRERAEVLRDQLNMLLRDMDRFWGPTDMPANA